MTELRLLDELGRGARGVVFRGEARGQAVAVKLPLEDNPEAWRRFRREGALLASVHHPAIPSVFELGHREDGRPYLVTELVEGVTLSDRLRAGPVTELPWLPGLVGALEAMHRRGLVHRDIKPSNILLVDQSARLIDFGLATRSESAEVAAGTLLYASPEQAGSLKRPVDPRSDLYSLGVVLFECLSGRPPFTSPDPGELMRQHLVLVPPELKAPPALAAIVARLLRKDPDERYPSASSLLHDLERLPALEADLANGVTLELACPVPLAPEPLVGRQPLLQTLRERWQTVRKGRGAALLLLGPGGAGKSRLVRELLSDVPGFLGACPAGQYPFQPLRQAIQNGPLDPRRALRAAGPHAAALAGFAPALDACLDTPAVESSPELSHALAGWWIRLAEQEPVLLVMEDLHRVDPATLDVLLRLARELHRAPLFLLATSRMPLTAPLERLGAELPGGEWSALVLEELGREELAELATVVLGPGELDPALLDQLEQRTNRTPLGAREFLRAALDQGALLPRWGRWECDQEALARLELPSDVVELTLVRLGQLEPEHQKVLAYAALLGLSFEPQLLDRLFGEAAREALAAARMLQLLEDHRFVHDRIREAASSLLTANDRAWACAALARELEPRARSLEDWCRVARLHAEGASQSEIDRSHRQAGLMALRSHAYEAAFQLLERVSSPDVDLLEALGEAAHLTQRRSRALEVYARALVKVGDPLRRAHLHLLRCEVAMTSHDWSLMAPEAAQALHEAGARVPGGPFSLARAMMGMAGWLLSERVPLPLATGAERERHRLLARLYDFTARASFFKRDVALVLDSCFTGALHAMRLGPSRESVSVSCLIVAILAFLSRHSLARRYARKAEQVARGSGDPVAVAQAETFSALAHFFGGRVQDGERKLTRLLGEEESWLTPADHSIAVMVLLVALMTRGRYLEALGWLDRSEHRRRLVEPDQPRSYPLLCVRVVAESSLGRASDALEELLRRQREATANLRALALGAHLLALTQLGDVASLRTLLNTQESLPQAQGWHMRAAYLGLAWGRKTVLLASERPSEEELLAYERSVGDLRRITRHPIMESHRYHLKAVAARLRGQLTRADRYLEKAERFSVQIENDLAQFEIWLERARLARMRGLPVAARRFARAALELARTCSWQPRMRLVAREFSLLEGSGSTSLSPDVERLRLERQLAALLELSLASSRVLDLSLLIQNVLEHLLNLLGAERACLFYLRDGELQELAGRSHDGQVLEALTGYSRSLVEEVARSGRPAVVNAGQEGPVDSASSIELFGLKSMLAAPLFLREEPVGVLYLDTRLTRGLFTSEDAALLSALGSHIAISLETARHAEVEMLYQAESRRRELAEMVRDLGTELATTLEEARVWEVLQTFLRERLGASSEVEGEGQLAVPVGAQRLAVWRDPPLDEAELDLVRTFAGQAALALERARLFAEVTRLATTDGLTGISNRRHFFTQAERELSLAQRHGEALSAIMLDVDHFKHFNDEHGHEAGDEVLQAVARALSASTRREDLLARYGGEEFVMLLPRTAGAEALEVTAERLRQAVEAVRVRDLQVTISLGVAGLKPGEDLQHLLSRADEALYASKRAGRNRSTLAT